MTSKAKMRTSALFNWIIYLFIGLSLSTCQTDQEPAPEQVDSPIKVLDTLHIATSGNMQYVVQVLAQVFNLDHDVPYQVSVGNSQALSRQIAQDTLYDFLFSTDQAFLDSLAEVGFSPNKALDIAYGKLVLWTLETGYMPDFVALRGPSIQQVALPNPETTAYGATIQGVLEKEQMMDFLGPKLVYQENLMETNQLITSQAVSIGFTAKSMVLSPEFTELGSWLEVDDRLYDPVPHQFLRLHKGKQTHPLAENFEQFLKSQQVKDVLANFGFLPNGLLGNEN